MKQAHKVQALRSCILQRQAPDCPLSFPSRQPRSHAVQGP